MAAAGLLDRKGHGMLALLTAALTALLVSPISWDHHWVWIAPGVVVAAHYAVQLWRRNARRAAAACGLLALAIVAWFGAWPTSLFGVKPNLGDDSLGLIWIPKNTDPIYYDKYGDKPWLVEYHWHGLQLIAGNAYILAGLAMFGLMLALALLLPAARKEHDDEPGRDRGGLRRGLRLPAARRELVDQQHRFPRRPTRSDQRGLLRHREPHARLPRGDQVGHRRPITTLVNTHHHGDHTFGNFAFPEATVVGHEREQGADPRQGIPDYLNLARTKVDWGT